MTRLRRIAKSGLRRKSVIRLGRISISGLRRVSRIETGSARLHSSHIRRSEVEYNLYVSNVFALPHHRKPSFHVPTHAKIRQSNRSVANEIILGSDILVPESELDRIFASQLNFKDFVPDGSFAHVVSSFRPKGFVAYSEHCVGIHASKELGVIGQLCRNRFYQKFALH